MKDELMISKQEIEQVALVPQVPTPMDLLKIATSQGADIDKLTKLMELQERWEANEARREYNDAIARFKENPPDINKNKHVKFGNTEYNHATLDHVTDAVTKALSRVGITHRWSVQQSGAIRVTCVLTHKRGHSESTTLEAAADTSGSKNSIQAIGSTVTYLQRYTLLAAVGMAARGTDNDGAGASGGMDEDAVNDYLTAIQDSSSLQELQNTFSEAYRKADEAHDQNAKKAFIQAKDARKKGLR